MPFEGAQPGYAVRARPKPSLREARIRREQAERLKADLDSRFQAPKQRGYRSFLLRNATVIYRLVLTSRERTEMRDETRTWAPISVRESLEKLEKFVRWVRETEGEDAARAVSGFASHLDFHHTPMLCCSECFAELLDTMLRRRSIKASLFTGNGNGCHSTRGQALTSPPFNSRGIDCSNRSAERARRPYPK